MGMAVLYLPFFLVGHLIAIIGGFDLNGVSAPYQYALIVGNYIYCIAGFVFLRKALLHFFKDWITGLTLILVFVGTNYFHQSGYNIGMPHVYLFCLYAMLLWFTIQLHQHPGWKNGLLVGLVIGLLMLCRPTEGIAAVIPALYLPAGWNYRDKRQWIKKYRKVIIGAMAMAFSVMLPQLIYWKYVTGKFLFNSYTNAGEGMDFDNPHILEILFSFRNGWLTYTPVMGLALIGLIWMTVKGKQGWPWLIFTTLNIYLLSCWTAWWFNGGFGNRGFVQSYAVLAVGLGYIISASGINKWLRVGLLAVGLLAVFLNLFQTWQLNHGIISHSRMTGPYYQKVFLKTEKQPQWDKLLLVNRRAVGKEEIEYFRDYDLVKTIDEIEVSGDDKVTCLDSAKSICGVLLNDSHDYSDSYEVHFNELSEKDHLYFKISVDVAPVEANSKLTVVAYFKHNEGIFKYRGLDTEQLEEPLVPGKWNHVEHVYLSPELRSYEDVFFSNIWLRSGEVLIKNYNIEIYERKPLQKLTKEEGVE